MTKRTLAPILALAALTTAQAASAQAQACVAPADLGDTVIYAMPIAFDAARTTCGTRLDSNGFMARKGETFIGQFRARQNTAWPGAFRLIKTFMASGEGDAASGKEMNDMIAALPEASLRPFVDGLVGQMIAEQIKPDSCGKIERGLELLSPLPTENVGGLFAFIAEFADIKNPPICGTGPATAPRP